MGRSRRACEAAAPVGEVMADGILKSWSCFEIRLSARAWPKALALAGLLALAACGQRGPSGEDSLGQVVARVNGEEITVSQLNAELATVSANGQDPKAVRQEVLRAIVFRTLLRQAALKEKYDRRPQVRLLMDAARDKVLADVYVNAVAGAQKAPSQADIAKFIADHPLAFGERRIYRFERLMLAADQYSDNLVPMFDQKPQVQTFDQLETYLNGKHIPFTLTDVQLPSTDFPKQVQDELAKFHEGADDQNAHLGCAVAVQDISGHDGTMLRESIRQMTPSPAPAL